MDHRCQDAVNCGHVEVEPVPFDRVECSSERVVHPDELPKEAWRIFKRNDIEARIARPGRIFWRRYPDRSDVEVFSLEGQVTECEQDAVDLLEMQGFFEFNGRTRPKRVGLEPGRRFAQHRG